MGKNSKRRRAGSPGKPRYRVPTVPRPFFGMPHEEQLAAMRDLIPAASMQVRLSEDYGSREVTLVTVAPQTVQGLVRSDGVIMVAVQAVAGTQDAGHDLGLITAELLESEPGTVINGRDLRVPAPRLPEMVSDAEPMQVHSDFGFWLTEEDLSDETTRRAVRESATAMVPTALVAGTEAALWCHLGTTDYLRWVRGEEEDAVFDALARLRDADELRITESSHFIGAFRLSGLVAPVFEFDEPTGAEHLDTPVAAFEAKFQAAMSGPTLTTEQRRIRSGLVSRELSL